MLTVGSWMGRAPEHAGSPNCTEKSGICTPTCGGCKDSAEMARTLRRQAAIGPALPVSPAQLGEAESRPASRPGAVLVPAAWSGHEARPNHVTAIDLDIAGDLRRAGLVKLDAAQWPSSSSAHASFSGVSKPRRTAVGNVSIAEREVAAPFATSGISCAVRATSPATNVGSSGTIPATRRRARGHSGLTSGFPQGLSRSPAKASRSAKPRHPARCLRRVEGADKRRDLFNPSHSQAACSPRVTKVCLDRASSAIVRAAGSGDGHRS